MQVRKRNGRLEDFNIEKIAKAIYKVRVESNQDKSLEECLKEAKKILNTINKQENTEIIDIEEIQDAIERYFLKRDEIEIFKNFTFYREKRKRERLDPWGNNDERQDLILQKYLLPNETKAEFLQRISLGNDKLLKIFRKREALWGGRILYAIGRDGNITSSNCYVLKDPEDSLEDIYRADYEMAKTYAFGGGVGINLSKIRPKGAKVNNTSSTTPGVMNFAEKYSFTTLNTDQAKRRGALMLVLNIDHPDVIDFITTKLDINKINGANISLAITDEFMNAYNNDSDWELRFETRHELIKKKIKARDLMKLLSYSSHTVGDPGTLFIDTANNYHLLSEYPNVKFTATNPCLRGDMKILTSKGYVPIEELSGDSIKLVNKDGVVSEGRVFESGVKEIYEIKRGSKSSFFTTKDHKFMTNEGETVEAKDLQNKRLMPYLIQGGFIDEFVKYGFIFGDGCINRLSSKSHKGLEICIGAKDDDVREFFKEDIDGCNMSKGFAYYVVGFNDKLRELGVEPRVTYEKIMPTTFYEWSNLQKRSFLRGLFSANGCVLKNGRIMLKTASLELANGVIDELQSLGYNPYITVNKKHKQQFDNGVYEIRENYNINIQDFDSRLKFFNEIGFIHKYKNDLLKETLIKTSPRISSVETTGKYEKVYDFNEPLTNWGVMEGFITHNCGEQPLLPYSSCNLGSINLNAFVKKEFTQEAFFDYNRFEEVVEEMVKGLDTILDLYGDRHPLKQQIENVKNWREIGLGLMGLSDLSLSMSMGYGSKEFIEILDKIMSTMINKAVQTSSLIAKEKGTFPNYNYEYISNSKFFKEALNDETKEIVKKYGIRNSRLLSIAPTGSISNLVGVSGGVEPYFMLGYQRTIKSMFENERHIWVYEKTPLKLMKHLKIDNHNNLPEWAKITSQNIPFENRANVQATIQKYVDTGISSTFNLPNEATTEDIENIYIKAWELGLKGITVFRDNCKKIGILTGGGDSVDKNPAPKPSIIVEEEWINKSTNEVRRFNHKITISDDNYTSEQVELEKCPECGSHLVKQGGCTKCSNNDCYYEKCAL